MGYGFLKGLTIGWILWVAPSDFVRGEEASHLEGRGGGGATQKIVFKRLAGKLITVQLDLEAELG